MRILHTSDWHLGAALNRASLLDIQQDMLEQLLRVCDEQKIDGVIVAGDIFDRAVAPAEAISLYNHIMTQLCIKRGIPVFLCAGNHDGAARLSSLGQLLKEAGLYVAGSVRDGLLFAELGNCRIHLLPYFSIDEIRYLFPEEEIKSYQQAMRMILQEVHKNIDESKKNILVAHCYVSGAEVSESDRSVIMGGANMVGAELFSKFDYVALGHLHKPQQPAAQIRYCGAPIKLSFSEAGATKSFSILDTESMEVSLCEICLKNDLRVLKGTYEEIMRGAERDSRNDAYTKIVIEDESAHLELLYALRERYPNLLLLEGKAYEMQQEETSLSIEDVGKLTLWEIMVDFVEVYTGQRPKQELVDWFLEAQQQALKGGEVQ